MTNLKELFKTLELNEVSYKSDGDILEHWILCEENKKFKQDVLRKIFGFLGFPEVRRNYYVIEKKKKSFCKNPLCVHPDCHKISLRSCVNGKDLLIDDMTVEDIMEIAEEVDLEEYYSLGPVAFLKKFNSEQPDFLKINEEQLKAAIHYAENKND